VTEKHKRMLKKIGKVAAYTALTGGSYILARVLPSSIVVGLT
jgi:hypothetical protein